MNTALDHTNTPLDDVAFLALSENRLAILDVLTDEETYTRDELMNATKVSRPTLSRILDDLDHLAWITQHGQTCRITPLGAWVHDEFADLLETMDTAQKLRDVMRWFPTTDVDFDVIRCLNDAEMVFATESDPTAPIRRACEQLRIGTQLRFLTTQVSVWYFNSLREMVIQNGMTIEGVVTPDVYDTLVDDTALSTLTRDLIDSEDAVFFVLDDFSYVLQIVDDRVGIGLVDTEQNPQGFVLSDDEAVLTWAEQTFEAHREQATRLSSDEFQQRRKTNRDSEQSTGAVDAPRGS